MKAKNLLKSGETAIAIFTDGRNLEIKFGGKSISGVWRIDRKLEADKVIIYLRNKEKGINEIYIGDFSGIVPSTVKGLEHRFSVEFTNVEFVGETYENWNGFADTKRGSANPIRKIV